MKKLLTLILAICMIAACALPVGANNVSVSEGLQTIRKISMLGEESSIYDSEQTVAKEETSKGSSIEHSVKVTDYVTNRLDLFSFEFKTLTKDERGNTVGDDEVATSFLIGQGKQQDDAICALEFSEGKIYIIESDGKSEVEEAAYTCGEYVKVQVLADKYTEKYYVWFGDKNIMTDVPDVDGRAYRNLGKAITHLRIWRASHKTAGTLCVNNFSVTPLADKTIIPATPADEDYAYVETFPSEYEGAYDEGKEPWSSLKDNVLKAQKNSNAFRCNADDFAITEKGELVITTDNSDYLYHNWYFTKNTGYVSPDSDKLVIQVDIKSNANTAINLGSYAASAVPVRIQAQADKFLVWSSGKDVALSGVTATFVHEDVAAADYSTLTFLIETTNHKWSLWIDDKNVVARNDWNNTSNTVNSISFHAAASGNITYVDNIRVFEATDDFMNVYGVTSTATDINYFINSEDNSIVSFADTDYVTYSDSKGYYDGENIIFPLFDDTAYVRAVVSSGDYAKAYYSDGALTFSSGYISKGEIKVDGSNISIYVNLRNDYSARADEVKAFAAVFEGNTLLGVKECTYNSETKAYEADFGRTLENCTVKGYIWQEGTLRPVTP